MRGWQQILLTTGRVCHGHVTSRLRQGEKEDLPQVAPNTPEYGLMILDKETLLEVYLDLPRLAAPVGGRGSNYDGQCNE